MKKSSAIRSRWLSLGMSFWLTSALVLGIGSWLPLLVVSPVQASNLSGRMQSLRQSGQRWIEVDLRGQRLIAWRGKTQVYAVYISTGKSSTPTPSGSYAIQSKYRSARMQGPGYDVPDVPYTMYFAGSYAIHGAYWHRSFGTPVSHGCVNVAVNHAQWLYSWASIGTPVIVHR